MPFVVGQIVRPKLDWLRRTGELQDFNGRRTAQGVVKDLTPGISFWMSGVPYWHPGTSQEMYADTAEEQGYTVIVWDMEIDDFVTLVLPESAMVAGTVNGQTITTLFDPAPPSGPPSDQLINLVRVRS